MPGWKKINPADLRDDPPAGDFDFENNTGSKACPLPRQADHSSPPVDVDRFIREIKGMLVGDEYEYAEETLRGILKTIEATRDVTWGQYTAIENIAAKPNRRMDRGNGRWR